MLVLWDTTADAVLGYQLENVVHIGKARTTVVGTANCVFSLVLRCMWILSARAVAFYFRRSEALEFPFAQRLLSNAIE
jgi:hypothetical protein